MGELTGVLSSEEWHVRVRRKLCPEATELLESPFPRVRLLWLYLGGKKARLRVCMSKSSHVW